jgi:6-phosphogluconolactonase
MGPDGHVASLFPGKSHAVSWVVAEHASPKPPSQRLSLSYGALNRSRAVFFLASGEAKREAAQCAIAKADCDLPAAMIGGLELTRWYVDSEISRGLLPLQRRANGAHELPEEPHQESVKPHHRFCAL